MPTISRLATGVRSVVRDNTSFRSFRGRIIYGMNARYRAAKSAQQCLTGNKPIQSSSHYPGETLPPVDARTPTYFWGRSLSMGLRVA